MSTALRWFGWAALAGLVLAACSPPPRSSSTTAKDQTPAVVLELLDIVSTARLSDPAEELERKLLLARAAAEGREKRKAQALLDAVAPGIAKLPTIDPEDKQGKRINFRRADLRLGWIRAEARLDPVRALRSTLDYARETNPTYHAIALGDLLDGMSCQGKEVAAGIEANARMLLEPIRRGVESRTWVASHATQALPVVARAARLCGFADLGRDARTVAKRAVKLFEGTQLRVRACQMAVAEVQTASLAERPRAIEALTRYRLAARNRFEHADNCASEKLAFAARLAGKLGPSDPAREAMAELVADAVFRLSDSDLRYGHCGLSASLGRLAGLNPSAVAKGMGLVLAAWSKGSRLDGYCHVPSEAARAGRVLAEAGAIPEWLCSTLHVKPQGAKLGEAQETVLRRERVLAAIELGDRCPEAAGLLARLQTADVSLLVAARGRQIALDRSRAKREIAADLKRLASDDRYDYAKALLPAFWSPR